MPVPHISQTNFQNEVLNHKGVVMVDFYAVWCGPCKMTEPIIEELNNEYGSKIKFVKVDVDQNNDIAASYNIFSIPTFLIFKDGKVVGQTVGAQSKDGFKAELSKVISL